MNFAPFIHIYDLEWYNLTGRYVSGILRHGHVNYENDAPAQRPFDLHEIFC